MILIFFLVKKCSVPASTARCSILARIWQFLGACRSTICRQKCSSLLEARHTARQTVRILKSQPKIFNFFPDFEIFYQKHSLGIWACERNHQFLLYNLPFLLYYSKKSLKIKVGIAKLKVHGQTCLLLTWCSLDACSMLAQCSIFFQKHARVCSKLDMLMLETARARIFGARWNTNIHSLLLT